MQHGLVVLLARSSNASMALKSLTRLGFPLLPVTLLLLLLSLAEQARTLRS